MQWVLREHAFHADAEDVAQDVMSVLIRDLPRFERQRAGSFRRWLRQIMLHRLQNLWRERHKRASDGAGSFALSALGDPASSLSVLWDQDHDRYVLDRL